MKIPKHFLDYFISTNGSKNGRGYLDPRLQMKSAAPQSRHLTVAAGNQVGLEPILDGGSDRNEDAADPAPDDGY